VVPLLLGLLFNSWSAPDAAAYVRMAFASVAGAVIAILTVLALLVDRIIHRAPVATVVTFAVLAGVVVVWSAGSVGRVADQLVHNLALVN
jgi:hypothetical protein